MRTNKWAQQIFRVEVQHAKKKKKKGVIIPLNNNEQSLRNLN